MTTYLVNKRMIEDRIYETGEIIEDPDFDVDLLRARGYLTIVPDTYTGGSQKASEPRPPTVDEALAAGYSQEAAENLARGEFGPAEDAETAAIDENLSNQPPSDDQLKVLAANLSEEDLEGSLQAYNIEVADDASREDKEAALVAWLAEHPEMGTEPDEDEVKADDEGKEAEKLLASTPDVSIGAAPPKPKKGS